MIELPVSPPFRHAEKRRRFVEILLQSPATRKYIVEGRENELNEVIKGERDFGMQTLNDSLIELVENDYVHPKVALTATPNPGEVQMRLRGIRTG